MFDFVKNHMFYISLIATGLQVIGTLVLAMFSFYGLNITENKEAYMEKVPKIEILNHWLRLSQIALILLLIGILLSGLVSLATAI